MICWPVLAQNVQAASPAEQCHQAITLAAGQTEVPREILLAVALTESGRATAQGHQPWPWALNQGGEGFWFASKADALDHLNAMLAQGVSNIDIGCFQLNWRWHGEAFASVEAMIDPGQNAEYAARHLLRLRRQTGSWEKAVSAYHSATPDLAERYMARFMPIYAAVLDGGSAPATPLVPAGPRVNSYPLLQAGAMASAGSLVPAAAGLRPLFGAP
ncbi:transglycosylase SLT domain-containing protein [Pseudogemmobacter humi]|nr:transglycosylase SLT domain-containing protein [Pseudogemmobacter humi]